eukprot:TRINITY_DN30826_c0_g1_i1.p1 TRINITY_DN30826_c0_g1~~TRINITY_DN30826_c0_g1_i1.p1  ORF type:complete len:267 (+),score=62.65 TRINITY_DN30826_c0_g1_i1:55-801(+)
MNPKASKLFALVLFVTGCMVSWPSTRGKAIDREAKVITNDSWERASVGSLAERSEEELPLHAAAILGDELKLKQLLKRGKVKVNEPAPDGSTALHWAVSSGATNCIAELARWGGFIAQKERSGATPMHYAALNNQPTSIQALINYGGTVHEVDRYDNTPLHWASGGGAALGASKLLSLGGSISAKDEVGNTPLHEAAKNGAFHNNPDIVPLLLSKGADPKAVNQEGLTPYGMALRYSSQMTAGQLKNT